VQRAVIGVALSLVATGAQATNGYFSHGYGIKAKGQAGAAIAAPQDALTIATNPAGLAGIADGFTLGLDVFVPDREATFTQGGVSTTYDGNGTRVFLVPEAGYSRHVDERLVLGVALYGNGGMNTDYDTNPFGRFGAQGPAGVDFSQAFVSPAVAYQLSDTQTLGLAANLVYQRIELKGIGIFGGFSSSPARVSNVGYDDAVGWGVRVGWTGKLGPHVTLGATWQSKTRMSDFDQYAGLFADQGGFDIPENYGLGIAVAPTPALTLALDWQRILYAGVPSVGNPVDSLFAGVPLGADGGPGFGWDDIDVIKLGASYAVNDQWTLRGGVSHSDQPIPGSQTFFNTIAPGVVQTHLSLGATRRVGEAGELSLSYVHAFEETVSGSGSIPAAFGGGEVDLGMKQHSLGIAYSRKF
jgi:long-chain fatty acid transport protein